jgi:hypothetical protein
MNKTTIEVKQGRVIARKHQAWMLDTKGKQLPKESWSEQGKEVGKHTNGPAPKTLTALYALCKQILATKSPSQYKLRVSVDKRGLLKTCTYRAKGCVDDCTLGFSIDSLVFLPSQTLPK